MVDRLRRTPARAVVVTPAHQSPTGVVLSADRRHQLAVWARGVDGYVIEDDYDAEYRYDRRPVGALQGVGPDRVVYCGTASKSLAPGLRLGWLVVPADLVDPVVAQRRATDLRHVDRSSRRPTRPSWRTATSTGTCAAADAPTGSGRDAPGPGTGTLVPRPTPSARRPACTCS